MAVAVRELGGGVVGDKVKVYWEVEREISIVGLSEGRREDREHGREGAVLVDEVLGRLPAG